MITNYIYLGSAGRAEPFNFFIFFIFYFGSFLVVDNKWDMATLLIAVSEIDIFSNIAARLTYDRFHVYGTAMSAVPQTPGIKTVRLYIRRFVHPSAR